MQTTCIFDCEFLTAEGAPSRFWCGPHDPDPVIAQIGAVRLGLEADFPILDTLRTFVVPMDRWGNRYQLDPLFSRLTGITETQIDTEGVRLAEALDNLATFRGAARLWSWGKDELNMMAISCYIEGITPPIPARDFGNAVALLLKAGVPLEDLFRMRSDRLSAYFHIEHPPLRSHDACDDALNVAYTLQHLLRDNRLSPADLT